MTQLHVPYGKTTQNATLPDGYTLHTIEPNEARAAKNPVERVQSALDNPLGDVSLINYGDVRSVAVAINDKTRIVPHAQLLPPLLNRLETLGIAPENITLVIATGTHPVMPSEEYPLILPERLIGRYNVVCHDARDLPGLRHLGRTAKGTPVEVNRTYMEADLRIVVGNIEPHQFMGYSGGVKSAAIGLAGDTTINANHAMMMAPSARMGLYDENPARADVEEIGRMIGVHLALNALLNGKKEIVDVLFGEPEAVMRHALPRVDEIYTVPVGDPFDLMIVSPGGHPKDINIYQAQKALGHASPVVREGGVMIWCAACPEGTGSKSYEQWILDGSKHSHDDVFHHFEQEGFRVGPHKAFQLSRDTSVRHTMLISDMPDDFVRRLLLHPLPDLQTALDKALANLPQNARIGYMPSANNTIPVLG